MEGDNQETQKPKPKGFVKPQPHKFPVKQKVVMEPTPGEEGSFVHDPLVVKEMSDTLASRFYALEERFSNAPQGFDDFSDRVHRLMSMCMAKKLASSLSDEQQARHSGQVSKISRVSINGPSALVQIFDQFGSIEAEKLKFSMIGQPFLAFTYFVRAAITDPRISIGNEMARHECLYVNTAWEGSRRQLFDYCLSVINAWAQGAPPAVFNFQQGAVCRMSIPTLESGAVTYGVFVQHVEKPPNIVRMLQIAALIEPHLQGGPIPPEARAALAGRGVEFVEWTSQVINARTEAYTIEVESRVRTAFAGGANWVPILAMKNRGSAAQLLTKGTEDIFYCPFLLGGEALDLGWLVCSGNTYQRVSYRANKLTPPTTTKHGFVSFVEGMMKI